MWYMPWNMTQELEYSVFGEENGVRMGSVQVCEVGRRSKREARKSMSFQRRLQHQRVRFRGKMIPLNSFLLMNLLLLCLL